MEQGKKYFYKYVPINKHWGSNLEVLLKDNLLTFISPSIFNDPYDCRVFPKWTGGSESDLRQLIFAYLYKKKEEGTNISLIEEAVNEAIKKWRYKDRKFVDDFFQMWKSNSRKLMKVHFIASMTLSERPENMVLWSHYASQHKGFCLQFEFEPIAEMGCFKVNYCKEFPGFHEFVEIFTNVEKSAEIPLATKAKDWEYEKEWRLMWRDENGKDKNAVRGKIPQNALLSIILGSKIENKIRETIIKMASEHRPDIKIYTSELKESEFGFDFKMVNASE